MLTQAEIKLINSLKLNKNRRNSGFFIVEGPKIISELINYPEFEIHLIAAIKIWKDLNKELFSIEIKEITEKALQKLSNFSTANEVFAIVKMPEYPSFIANKDSLYLVLDGLQDPGNLGTIIRTADWFGITDIICSKDTVDCYNQKVVQATMGSILRVRCHYIKLSDFLEKQQFPIYGMLLDGKNILNEQLSKSGFIVVGNESKGISEEVRQYISHPLFIPSFRQSQTESLNASIATAIVCNEFRRRIN